MGRTIGNPLALTGTVRDYLLLGPEFFDAGARVPSEAQGRALWARYGSTLVHRPGRRPYGFWKFEMDTSPVPVWWHEEVALLLRAGLIDSTEAGEIEDEREILAPHSIELCGIRGDLKVYPTDLFLLRCARDEFTLAAEWHRWRDRPQLAAGYAMRAEAASRAMGKPGRRRDDPAQEIRRPPAGSVRPILKSFKPDPVLVFP